MAWLFILLNPYNLIALDFATSGLAIWGAGPDYTMDYSPYTLFKTFGIPTLAFAIPWFGLSAWKKLSYWKLYILSSILSLLLIIGASGIYWKIMGVISVHG